ncbi:HIT family protein [bacterium]|nr:HIT family protein [bacterium]MBU1957605.1 HIT family protein [bacterium]
MSNCHIKESFLLVYENELVKVEVEESEIPWLKIFSQKAHKEFSECSAKEKLEIFRLLDSIEKEMLNFFKPCKINIASFGNYMPHVHWHIMARFEEDSFFPEPMWGSKQREGSYKLENFELFLDLLKQKL